MRGGGSVGVLYSVVLSEQKLHPLFMIGPKRPPALLSYRWGDLKVIGWALRVLDLTPEVTGRGPVATGVKSKE